MQVIRRILSVVFVLAFALGTTVQAVQIMPMKGMMGDMTTLGMSVTSAPVCPDCDDMDQNTMDMAVCQSSICLVPSMLPPEIFLPVSAPAASTVPYVAELGWGEAPHPEPYPPKATLRI